MSYTTKQIAGAFLINSVTLRKWANPDAGISLRLDADEGRTGWRRYTDADAARVCILTELVGRNKVESAAAVRAVNELFEAIAEATNKLHQVVQDENGWPHGRGPWFLISSLQPSEVKTSTMVFHSIEDLLEKYKVKKRAEPKESEPNPIKEFIFPPTSTLIDFNTVLVRCAVALSRHDVVRMAGDESGDE